MPGMSTSDCSSVGHSCLKKSGRSPANNSSTLHFLALLLAALVEEKQNVSRPSIPE